MGIGADSRTERDRLDEETTRLQKANADVRERYKAFLLEALSVVEGTATHQAVPAPDAAVAQADESPTPGQCSRRLAGSRPCRSSP